MYPIYCVWSAVISGCRSLQTFQEFRAWLWGARGGAFVSPSHWLSALWNNLCWLRSWPRTDVNDLHHQAVQF